MNKVIIGNLKMNLLPTDTENYLKELKDNLNTKNQVGVALPFTSLNLAQYKSGIMLGAQNVHYAESGAYTGEVSAEMLKQSGCDFCIVGHSERRQNFKESNAFIGKKIKALLKHGVKVVLCVGESQSERDSGKTSAVLTKQLDEALAGLYENELLSIIIAYEPVWAIGTGKVPTVKQATSAVEHIRKNITSHFSAEAGKNVIVLYGGSVKKDNVKKFVESKGIDGALVGGASNDAKEFAQLINLAN